MTLDLKEIQEKIEKEGEESLTDEEQQVVMSQPNLSGDESVEQTKESDEDVDPNRQVNLEESTGIKKEEDTEKKTPEDNASDKDKKTAGTGEPEKKEPDKETPAGEENKEPTEERKEEIKKESEKSLVEANLEKYTSRERALFFDLRKERRKRQDTQAQLDTLKFQNLKKQIKDELGENISNKKLEELLKDKEDDDVVTIQEIREVLEKEKKSKPEEKVEEKQTSSDSKIQAQLWIMQGEKKTNDDDFEKVVDLAGELLSDDKDSIAEINEAIVKGDNPAIVTYKLVKNHPKFQEVSKRLGIGKKPEDEKKEDKKTNEERKTRIETNNKKTVTTGSPGGSAPAGEYSMQELVDMPDEDYAKLSPEKREQILKMVG